MVPETGPPVQGRSADHGDATMATDRPGTRRMGPGLALLLALAWLLPGPGPGRRAFSQVPAPVLDPAPGGNLRARRDAILARGAIPSPASNPDGSTRFVPLPAVAPAPDPKAAPDAARAEAARDLMAVAGDAAKARPPLFALADECLRLALAHDPGQPEARRLLGFVPDGDAGGWITPHAREMRAAGRVDDPDFGWVPADWVPHLHRGELPAPGPPGQWLPAAEANARRRRWTDRWIITTEHYEVGTNVPLADAISFGRKLEILHELYYALAADLALPDRLPLALRYAGKPVRPVAAAKRLPVSYYATRDEFARQVAPVLGANAQESLGVYIPRRDSKALGGKCFFFDDRGGQLPVEATLFHEGSHQLLFDSGGQDRYDQNVGNYWVFEGLGTYFETLTLQPDGSVQLGGLVGPRIREARARVLGRGEFVPTRDLVALDKERFNQRPEVFTHYAESMAFAVFLMQAEGGRYRAGFLDYVQDAYRGRLRPGIAPALEARLGVPHEELDRKFLDYLRPR